MSSISEGLKRYWASAAAAGRRAKAAADRNKDGKLSLADISTGAKQAKSAITGAAKKAGARARSAADRNKDGQVNRADITAGARQARGAITGATRSVVNRARSAADRNKDGKLSGADVKEGARQARSAVTTTAGRVRRAAVGTYNRVANAVVERRRGSTQASGRVTGVNEMTVTARRIRS